MQLILTNAAINTPSPKPNNPKPCVYRIFETICGYAIKPLARHFDWAFAYEKHSDMFHVGFETLKRAPKASYYAFKPATLRS